MVSIALGSLALFAGLLLGLRFGQRLGRRRLLGSEERESGGFGAVNGAVFGLLGLLIAFTFSGAATRFEGRRALILEEANAVSTAYLRLDLLKPQASERLKEQFRAYLDQRLAAYGSQTLEEALARHDVAMRIQNRIWTEAVPAAADVGMAAPQLLLPALNAMFDITTTRVAALENHPPTLIYVLLILLALISSALAGFEMPSGASLWGAPIAFAATVSLTLFITFDIEHPRGGVIRVEHADHLLTEVRQSMK